MGKCNERPTVASSSVMRTLSLCIYNVPMTPERYEEILSLPHTLRTLRVWSEVFIEVFGLIESKDRPEALRNSLEIAQKRLKQREGGDDFEEEYDMLVEGMMRSNGDLDAELVFSSMVGVYNIVRRATTAANDEMAHYPDRDLREEIAQALDYMQEIHRCYKIQAKIIEDRFAPLLGC